MFRRLITAKHFLALLLLFAFFWSWAACTALCDEITAQHDNFAFNNATEKETCVSLNAQADGCTMTTDAAVIQERQNVKAPAPVAALFPVSNFRAPLSAWPALLPEINQNSPPKVFSPPLRALFCTLRI